MEEVGCGRREEREVERILAEKDKQVLYSTGTRRVDRAHSVPFESKKESQATDACGIPLVLPEFSKDISAAQTRSISNETRKAGISFVNST